MSSTPSYNCKLLDTRPCIVCGRAGRHQYAWTVIIRLRPFFILDINNLNDGWQHDRVSVCVSYRCSSSFGPEASIVENNTVTRNATSFIMYFWISVQW